jgi:hypothetical protein
MAEEYLEVYRGLIEGNRRRRPRMVNGTAAGGRQPDDRHQTGTNDGIYVAD